MHDDDGRPVVCSSPTPAVPCDQATHAAVRKQKEEEEAMQADELGFKKCVVGSSRALRPPCPCFLCPCRLRV